MEEVRALKTPCLINVQCIQMFATGCFWGFLRSGFIHCQNRLYTIHFTHSLTILYQHLFNLGSVVYWNSWHRTEMVYYLQRKWFIFIVWQGWVSHSSGPGLCVCLPSSLQCVTRLWLGQKGIVYSWMTGNDAPEESCCVLPGNLQVKMQDTNSSFSICTSTIHPFLWWLLYFSTHTRSLVCVYYFLLVNTIGEGSIVFKEGNKAPISGQDPEINCRYWNCLYA